MYIQSETSYRQNMGSLTVTQLMTVITNNTKNEIVRKPTTRDTIHTSLTFSKHTEEIMIKCHSVPLNVFMHKVKYMPFVPPCTSLNVQCMSMYILVYMHACAWELVLWLSCTCISWYHSQVWYISDIPEGEGRVMYHTWEWYQLIYIPSLLCIGIYIYSHCQPINCS